MGAVVRRVLRDVRRIRNPRRPLPVERTVELGVRIVVRVRAVVHLPRKGQVAPGSGTDDQNADGMARVGKSLEPWY